MIIKNLVRTGLALALATLAASAFSADDAITVKMNEIDAAGKLTAVGTVTLTENTYGLLLTPNLTGLPPGVHGFHVHEKADCGNTTVDGKVTVAGAAGGHWDPDHSAEHDGPYSKGHRGDLPVIYVAADGTAVTPVLAPRIKSLADVHGLALMIHAGGDNHSDHPAKFGGGGARIACGVIN